MALAVAVGELKNTVTEILMGILAQYYLEKPLHTLSRKMAALLIVPKGGCPRDTILLETLQVQQRENICLVENFVIMLFLFAGVQI